jgi:4-hydroxybenzoate polyprenyltransferase
MNIKTLHYLILSLRPQQWIKNFFVFIPLIFSRNIFNGTSLRDSFQAFIVFCLLASATYLYNDINDIEHDQNHPTKKHRPLAAGLISKKLALITASVFLAVSLCWSVFLGRLFFIAVLSYLLIQVLYNYRLKSMVILDIFCISAGFFLRVISGAFAIKVDISHWLIICTVLISFFLTLSKRRHELSLLGNASAQNHRKVLSEYSTYLLDQMISIITASTILSYMLYCISSETINRFQTDHLIYTIPFVMYGIFRYLYLIHKKNMGGSPEKVLMTDRPLMLSVFLWGMLCISIIYFNL